MKQVRVVLGAVVAALVVVVAATGCGGGSDSSNASAASGGDCNPGDSPVITLAAYSNPYDAYGKLTSTFAADWKESHSDQQVIFQMSFGGSTTQAENIVNGFPADVYASSTAPDVQLVQDAASSLTTGRRTRTGRSSRPERSSSRSVPETRRTSTTGAT